MTGPALQGAGLAVGYGGAPVIAGLDIEVGEGEVLALLGPSGSGKSTLLSAIAGFLRLAAGELRIGGEVVAAGADPRSGRRARHVPPERRSVGVVFQGYALWPHLSALDNVAYPLRRAGADAASARRRAGSILQRLGIGHLAARRPAELSGGEQQRVGLGRAIAREARLYLFDEPTAHLDAALRTRLQDELAEHRRRLGAAAVYATHDTAEALALADRVALLRDGRIVQSGRPAELYERPVDMWAALLTGPAAVVDVRLLGAAGDGVARIDVGGDVVDLPADGVTALRPGPGRALVRPDWAHLGGPLPARVEAVAYRGTHTDYQLATPAGSVGLRAPGTPGVERGASVGWTLERAWILAPEPLEAAEQAASPIRAAAPEASKP